MLSGVGSPVSGWGPHCPILSSGSWLPDTDDMKLIRRENRAEAVILKRNVKRRKKRTFTGFVPFIGLLGDVDHLCHYTRASLCATGGALAHGTLSDSSLRELMDDGSSLPFEKPDSRLL